MSKYLKIAIQFKDEAAFQEALRDVCKARGIQFEQGDALHLYGYRGDQRDETAEYVIRRQHVESSANDLGFARQADGSLGVVISEFDSGPGRAGAQIMSQVRQRYARLQVEKQARARGMRVEEVQEAGGTIRLRLYQTAATRQPLRQTYAVRR